TTSVVRAACSRTPEPVQICAIEFWHLTGYASGDQAAKVPVVGVVVVGLGLAQPLAQGRTVLPGGLGRRGVGGGGAHRTVGLVGLMVRGGELGDLHVLFDRAKGEVNRLCAARAGTGREGRLSRVVHRVGLQPACQASFRSLVPTSITMSSRP